MVRIPRMRRTRMRMWFGGYANCDEHECGSVAMLIATNTTLEYNGLVLMEEIRGKCEQCSTPGSINKGGSWTPVSQYRKRGCLINTVHKNTKEERGLHSISNTHGLDRRSRTGRIRNNNMTKHEII